MKIIKKILKIFKFLFKFKKGQLLFIVQKAYLKNFFKKKIHFEGKNNLKLNRL